LPNINNLSRRKNTPEKITGDYTKPWQRSISYACKSKVAKLKSLFNGKYV
jgi:hypothetical protein